MDFDYDKVRKRIPKFRKLLRFVLIIIVLGYIGTLTIFMASKGKNVEKLDTSKLESDIDKTEISERYKPLFEKVDKYVKEQEGSISVYFRDYGTSDEFGISDLNEFTILDTINLPINLYLYKLVNDEIVNINDQIEYTKEFQDERSKIFKDVEFGKKYTLENISKYSLENNDYTAINMLKSKLGKENYVNYMVELGGQTVSENGTSAKDMGYYIEKTLQILENSEEIGGKLIYFLKKSPSNKNLKKLLPADVDVAGIYSSKDNTNLGVGAILTKNPFILTVMVKDVDNEKALDIISNIYKYAYDFQVSLEF